MSRWYLTSSEDSSINAESVCDKAGLRSSGHISDPNCHAQAYMKRVVDVPTFVKCGENDWICSAGTIIYNGRLGPEAFLDMYSDFVKSGIHGVRSRAIGHYALAIRHNNNVTVFTDPQGAITLYYINTGSFWFVSNSLDLCAHVLPVRRIDPIKLAMTALQTCTPGEDTFYAGIKRLFGTQVIDINIKDGKFRVDNIPNMDSAKAHNYSSLADAIDHYKSEVRAVFRELAGVGSIGLFGTGGLDSRTVLAALLDQKVTPQIMYGVGNSRLTDGHPTDISVAKNIAKTFNLPFQQLDWSGEQPYTQETLQELFKMYGFQYEIYGASQQFLRSIGGGISPYPNLILGGSGPVFTNRKPWQLEQTNFSFDDLIEYAMPLDVKRSDFLLREPYKSSFSQEVRIGLLRGQIDYPETGASLKTFVRAFLFLYLRPEARFLNFANEFCHYISPFLMKRLHDPLIDVPFEYRAKDKFQVGLIHALTPDLLDLPVCSGHRNARFNRDTFEMMFVEEQTLLGRLASALLPSSCIEPARQFYHRIKHAKREEVLKIPDRDMQIIQTYGRQAMTDPIANGWFSSASNLHIKSAERIAHYLVGVNSLGYSE